MELEDFADYIDDFLIGIGIILSFLGYWQIGVVLIVIGFILMTFWSNNQNSPQTPGSTDKKNDDDLFEQNQDNDEQEESDSDV